MTSTSDLLLRLVAETRAEVERRQADSTLGDLERRAAAQPPARDLGAALRQGHLAVIAEMKARTPVMGRLSEDYAPGRLAASYSAAGAAAISVLCQETSFGGHPEHLAEARAASALPIVRKDFIVTEHQILEARALGADAVLLIVAALEASQMAQLLDLTWHLGMEALVEVHDESEVDAALAAGAMAVGVNHRDLSSFTVDLGLTERLRPRVPREVAYVAESGIHTAQDAIRMRAAGANAILVGEALMRAQDHGALIRELSV